MIYEVEWIMEGSNPIMDFAIEMVEDIQMGLFILHSDPQNYFEQFAKEANDRISFDSFALSLRELKVSFELDWLWKFYYYCDTNKNGTL